MLAGLAVAGLAVPFFNHLIDSDSTAIWPPAPAGTGSGEGESNG
ncbi:hypothetical protein ACIOMM_36145 [Streptomyces sp. NPDC087908]